MNDRDPPEGQDDGPDTETGEPPSLAVIQSMSPNSDEPKEETDTPTETPPVGANDEALLIRLTALEQDHQDLGLAIEALENQPHYDRLAAARLKKKKLQLKDKIQELKNALTPDIIA